MFVLKNPSFEANLVLSTLHPDTESQSIPTPKVNSTLKKKAPPKRAPSKTSKSVSKASKTKATNEKSYQTSRRTSQSKNTTEEDLMSMSSVSLISEPENHVNRLLQTKDKARETKNIPSPAPSTPSTVVMRTNSALQTLFPPIPRRKSNPGGSNQRNDDEIVPCSPPRQPSKKARLIFQKCFKATFDPRMLPGHDKVLAEDSDEET